MSYEDWCLYIHKYYISRSVHIVLTTLLGLHFFFEKKSCSVNLTQETKAGIGRGYKVVYKGWLGRSTHVKKEKMKEFRTESPARFRVFQSYED